MKLRNRRLKSGPDLAIDWRIPADKLLLSEKDRHHGRLRDAEWLFDYHEKLY